MEEGSHISEDFLSCPLCTEEYQDPRSLSCLHSFCLNCITDHIDDSTKGQKNPKGFDCPVCHKHQEAPIQTQGPQTWAEALPVNQFIVGLLEAVKLRSSGRRCDPCFRRGNRNLASTWCEQCGDAMCDSCQTQHNSMKNPKNHTVVDIEKIKLQPIKSTVLRTPCPEHNGKFLDFYCEDHVQVICSTCATGFHRKCSSVLSASDAANKQRDEAKSVIEKLRHQTSWATRIADNRKHVSTSLDDAAINVKKQIESIKKQINDILSAQEERILEQLEQLKSGETQHFDRELERCNDLINTTKNAASVLQNSLTHGTDADILLTFSKASTESYLCEKSLKEVSRQLKDVVLVFSPDKSLQMFLGTLREMGKFSLSHQPVQIPPPYSVRQDTIIVPDEIPPLKSESPEITRRYTGTPDERELPRHRLLSPSPPPMTPLGRDNIPQAVLETFFKARTTNDRDNCCFTGAEYVSEGRIVLTDQVHRKVKMFNHAYKWIGERVLSARPYDITSTSSTEIAVTLPKEKRFILMHVRDTDFTIVAAVQTGAKCWGINYCNHTFAVCCYGSPPCIKLMSRDGRELKVISKDTMGHNLFFFPEYIVVDRSNTCMYVTDRYKKSVTALTTLGDKLWEVKYDGLKMPKGIALHGTRLFVAGCKSHNVMMISTDGQIMGEVVVEGVSNPHKLVLSPGSDKLLVTQYAMTLIDVEKNTVKIFSLPW
ncbi:hypothetical protein CHS0354_034714 [Potamilus streckersoni]|uniref:Uncharacterized protein n=1 Tax=Potamilus streckersoni TaxID=2493646 RepID=A0AAE0SJ02_9BIVA|nr:hypothetical protein CHS0354_034714 [Potamilus streckersoni]